METATGKELKVHRVFFEDVSIAERKAIHLIICRCACKVILGLADRKFDDRV